MAFDDLRRRVASEPILAQPNINEQFDLEVDASGFAVGAVLLQKKEDGKRHPVGYYSATLNEAERNYSTTFTTLNSLQLSKHSNTGNCSLLAHLTKYVFSQIT